MRISLNELKSLIRSEARRSLKREANRDFERDFRDTPQDEPDGPRRVPGPGDLDYEEDVCDTGLFVTTEFCSELFVVCVVNIKLQA